MSQLDPRSLDHFYAESLRPGWKAWVKHTLLMLVTFCTMTIAGTLWPFGLIQYLPEADPQSFSELLQMLQRLPAGYISVVSEVLTALFTSPAHLKYGLSFSISLIFILLSHEMGHYITCRLYRVHATLPFFIPTPPMIGPAGTFGAFIKDPVAHALAQGGLRYRRFGPDRRIYRADSCGDHCLRNHAADPPEMLQGSQSAGLYFSDPLFLN